MIRPFSRCASALATLALALGSAGPAAAQGRVEVRVYPRAGLVSPDGYFYEYFKNFFGDGVMEWTSGSLGRALAVGAGVEIGFPGKGILVRGEVVRTLDGWLSSVHSVEVRRDLFEPPTIRNTWLDIPASVTSTHVQVILPTRFEFWRMSPYVLGGVGGKFYRFGEPLLPNDVGATLPQDGFTWGGDVGVGFTLPAWRGLTLDFQFRDALSRYWGKTQHDLLYSAAVLWPLR